MEKSRLCKGAPEVVLKFCSYIYINGKAKKLTEEMQKEILETNKEFANDLKGSWVCIQNVNGHSPGEKPYFVGLQGMIDPPRKK